MDLLKQMLHNREVAGVPLPKTKGTPKAERTKQYRPGSKMMKNHIIEEKPGKKVVREHFEAIVQKVVDRDCASSSDED